MVAPLSDQSARYLLELARSTIRAELAGDPPPQPSCADPRLSEPAGAFVTLRRNHALRGCIGRIEAQWPLWETVVRMARAAAFDDPRFPAVEASELDDIEVEISVMSPPRAVDSPEVVIAGRHGVMICRGRRRAVFLPQVASEQGWNRDTLLEQLCLKAGLPADAWQDPAATIEVFEAVVIEERERR